jgi:hypothetical protein
MGRPFHPDDPILPRGDAIGRDAARHVSEMRRLTGTSAVGQPWCEPARGHTSPAAARAGYRTDVGYPVVTAHGNDALQ